MSEATIIERLDRIDRDNKRILALLTGEKKEKTWVKASAITQLTGWNKEKMRRMRVNGIVKFKHDKTGFWYDPNSIPSIFIRYENATTRSPGVDGAGHVLGKTLKS